jgi:hypothetical protein
MFLHSRQREVNNKTQHDDVFDAFAVKYVDKEAHHMEAACNVVFFYFIRSFISLR